MLKIYKIKKLFFEPETDSNKDMLTAERWEAQLHEWEESLIEEERHIKKKKQTGIIQET